MNKIVTITLSLVAALLCTTQVYAAKYVSVRLEQPKSPVNQSSFTINFVALDLLGRTVTVKCFKKGPSDGAFSQFGSDQVFADGGNSGNCAVDGGVVNAEGAYTFKVEAKAGDGGSDNADDESTSVTFDTSGPGDVGDYNKTKTNSCEYTIHYKTAADSGATTKVELYRAESVPFNADHNSRIQSIVVGSNEIKDTTDTPADCNKTYYYAIRAFDSAGNGSALVGDTVTNITVINPTAGTTTGAIAVNANSSGSVLGSKTEIVSPIPTPEDATQGETLGATNPAESNQSAPQEMKIENNNARNLTVGGGILILGALLYAFFQKRKNQPPQIG